MEQQERKLLVFLSDANPVWAAVRRIENFLHDKGSKDKVNHASRHSLLSISAQTLTNWRHAERASSDRLKHSFGHLVGWLEKHVDSEIPEVKSDATEARVRVLDFQRVLTAADKDVYAAGHMLNLRDTDSQKAIDTELHSFMPLLRLGYYRKKDEGRASFEEHAGMYFAWVRRPDDTDRRSGPVRRHMWLQATMEVRYVVEALGGSIIRTKLNVPDLNGGASRSFEYDGFLRELSVRLYWTFEKRSSTRQDFFYLVTDLARQIDGKRTHDGSYLTTGQDSVFSIVHDRVVLQRFLEVVRTDDDAAAHRQEACDRVSVLREGDPEFQYVENLVQDLDSRVRTGA